MADKSSKKIKIDDDLNGNFVLCGDTDGLLNDKRARFYLRAINAKDVNGSSEILIQYEKESKEKTLNDIQSRLLRLGVDSEFSKNVREAEEGFVRAKESFGKFSECARKIRDNTFKEDSNLLSGFNQFVGLIKREVPGRVLYPLQLLSAYHMAFTQNSCNFSVPGAGKTTIVYAAYAYLKSIPDIDKRVDKILVIGPTAAFGPWEDEYEECFNRKPSIIKISEQRHEERKQHFYGNSPAEVTVIGYQLLDKYRQDIEYFLKKHRVMLVLDEAHYIKAVHGVWSTALLGFSSKAVARIALTGTPAPNGYEDLYNLYRFILPFNYEEVIGMNYRRLKELADDKHHPDRIGDFSSRVEPFFTRIKKKDLQLPKVVNHAPIMVEMSPAQREIYDFIEGQYVNEFQGSSVNGFRSKLTQAKIIRLRQAATNPELLNHPLEEYYSELGYSDSLHINDEGILSCIRDYKNKETPPKFTELLSLTKRILSGAGEKVIIWSQFVYNSKQIRAMFQSCGLNSELLIGEVERENRRHIIKKFNSPEDMSFRIVIAHPKAVGESVSLHKGCHNAIYFDMDYNAASYIQSRDRIHRVIRPLPQNSVTNYYSIVSKESIEEIITEKVRKKVEIMEGLIDKDIPLFVSNGLSENDDGADNIVKALIDDYVRRTSV